MCSNSDTNILLKFESFLGGSIDRPFLVSGEAPGELMVAKQCLNDPTSNVSTKILEL